MRTRVRIGTLALAGSLVALASPAGADLYRCERPDGGVTYTDNAAACPRARKHETTGEVQTIPTTLPRADRAPVGSPVGSPAPSLSQQAETSAEAAWRQKKSQSERELAELESRHEQLREAVGWCNRGGELWQKDETGIKHGVSCRSVKREFGGVESRRAELRQYLDGGLEEECRRAGCLPGWIR